MGRFFCCYPKANAYIRLGDDYVVRPVGSLPYESRISQPVHSLVDRRGST